MVNKVGGESCWLNHKMAVELVDLSIFEVGGMRGVAVKCIDITQNSDCEGSLLNYN